MTSWADDDDNLMAGLGDALEQEGEVTAHRRHAAYGAFAWRNVDQELLTLTHDSTLSATAAVRASADARTLAFEGGGLFLELEIDGPRLMGQVLGAVSGQVTIESAGGDTQTVATDRAGMFAATLATGPLRFVVRADASGVAHRTEWVVL